MTRTVRCQRSSASVSMFFASSGLISRENWASIAVSASNRQSPLVRDFPTDNIARNDDFNAPIFLASLARVVVRNRHGLAESHRRYAIGGQPLRNEKIA